MAQKKQTYIRRNYKYYLLGLFVILFCLIVGSWLFMRHFKPIFSRQIKKEVFKATDSLYHVNFSAIHLNPLLGNLTIDSLYIIPDTAQYNRLRKRTSVPDKLFEFFVAKLKLKHIRLFALITNRKAKVEAIKAEKPQLKIYQYAASEEKENTSVKQTLTRLTSGSLKAIQIEELDFYHVFFSQKNMNSPQSGTVDLENLNIQIKDVKIDTATVRDTSRFLFAKDIRLSMKQSLFYTSDSLYKIATDSLFFSVNRGRGFIKGLKLKPRYSEQQFESQFEFRNDRFEVAIDSLLFYDLSPQKLKQKKWHFKKIKMRDAAIDIYLDAALPIEKVEKPLPQKMLRHLGINLRVDTLKLKNINIKYRERNPKTNQVGAVSFNQIHGNILNITNDSMQLLKNKYCKVDLQTLFMNRGKLHAFFNFDLTDPENSFSYKGHLGALKVNALNPATHPLGQLNLKKGRIHSLDYEMNADNHGAVGKVALNYDQLEVKVLSKSNRNGNLKKQGLISFAANIFIIKNANRSDSFAQISYKRDPYRSVFNLMWKSIFTGVKPLIGIDKKTEQKIKSLKSTKNELKNGKEKAESKGLSCPEIGLHQKTVK